MTLSAGIWLLLEAAVGGIFADRLRGWAVPPAALEGGAVVMPGHPFLIYEYRPGTHEERGVTVRINRLGLRGPEVQVPKPRGRTRLMVTGDSSVFGFGVEEKEVFVGVAAQQLGVEPVNAALPGYSTWQTLHLLELRALATQPDLVVICNLWSDNTFDRFVDREILATLARYEDGWRGRVHQVFSYSAIFRLAELELRTAKNAELARGVTWRQDPNAEGRLGVRRVEINEYAANLRKISNRVTENGAEVAFLLLPNRVDIDGGDAPRTWDPYRDVLRAIAQETGAVLVDGPSLFDNSQLSAENLFIDEMHPSAEGHRILGEGLASALAARGWPTKSAQVAPGTPAPEHWTDPHLPTTPKAGGYPEIGPQGQ
jgi:lysophospholipase L1-like esterase